MNMHVCAKWVMMMLPSSIVISSNSLQVIIDIIVTVIVTSSSSSPLLSLRISENLMETQIADAHESKSPIKDCHKQITLLVHCGKLDLVKVCPVRYRIFQQPFGQQSQNNVANVTKPNISMVCYVFLQRKIIFAIKIRLTYPRPNIDSSTQFY